MKKVLIAACVLCMALALTACGKKNPVTGYKSGDVTLGEYKNLTYTPLSIEVTDEDVMKSIETGILANNKKNVEITDRTVIEDGDVIIMDYEGLLDGVAFEGGTATDAELTIGSGSFIDGFESGLIGKSVGEDVELNLKFPDPYLNNPDMAGKAVVFKVKVKGIYTKVTPELTDEFIASTTESYKTVEEYKAYIKENLITSKTNEANSRKEYDVISKAIENATFNKDLTSEIETAKANMISSYNASFTSYYGVDAATFYSALYGMTAEQFDEYMLSEATMNVKYSYLLSAIAETEELTASDDEVDELANEMMTSFGCSTKDELYALMKQNYNTDGKVIVGEQVKLNKAGELILGSAVAE